MDGVDMRAMIALPHIVFWARASDYFAEGINGPPPSVSVQQHKIQFLVKNREFVLFQ
jgi:hypothetical protein